MLSTCSVLIGDMSDLDPELFTLDLADQVRDRVQDDFAKSWTSWSS